MSREPLSRPFLPRSLHVVSVTLDAGVLAKAAAFAEQIEMANRRRRRKNVQGLTAKGKESLKMRVSGYSGEAAVAIHLGMSPDRIRDDWRGRGTVAYPDVGPFDVMTTDKPHGSLIITPRDRLDMMKVLVIDQSPVFHICGWYRVGDARLEAERSHSEWWRVERSGGGAWYIPQAFLFSLTHPEAMLALMQYSERWRQQHRGFLLYKEGGKIERVPDDGTFKGLEVNHVEIDGIGRERDDDRDVTYDWREVLRRAGAAPPDEEEFKAYHRGVFPPERKPEP